MTKPNDPINFTGTTKGLTKREQFAAMRKSEMISAEHAEILMGKPAPQRGSIQYLEYFVEAQERLSVMYADALIKVLNETQPANNEQKTLYYE